MRRKFSTDHVPYSALLLDPSYQRQLISARVRKFVREWDFEKVGAITVSLRSDGKYYVIDGQHRKAAAMELGYGSTKAFVHTYKGLTPEEEAALFLSLNDSRPVTPIDKYKAGLRAGDPVCLKSRDILAEFGLRVGSNDADGVVRCVSRVMDLCERDPEVLREVCAVATEAWGTRKAALEQVVFSAMGMVLAKYNGQLDRSRLAAKLAKYRGGPAALSGDASGLADYKPISKTRAAAEIIVETYNKGASSKRLPAL